MPLVRIDVNKHASAALVRTVSDAIYSAMVEVAKAPPHDKFHIVTRHEADEIIYPSEGYFRATYSPDLIIIQIVWLAGRSSATKREFFRRVVEEIHAKQNIRKEDVIIVISSNDRDDWSFGNGEMQYGSL